jgi:UDP-N-acetylglucosamine:LPS N-acetylglucosamine transferase
MTPCGPVVDFVYFNAGGGHRAAAQALQQSIEHLGLPWRVRLVNLTAVLDPQGLFKRLTGFEPEDLYNKRLASGFTLGLAQELKLLQSGIRLAHATLVERLAAHWAATGPDLVVSLIPNFNRALGESVQAARPGVPFATVLTDMADHPPAFWIEPTVAQHLVCGTARAAEQALAAGVPPERVHRVQGMVLRPAFHEPPAAEFDRRAERLRLGLPAEAPVGLVLFGGAGSRAMRRLAERLPTTPLVLMCGRNAALARALRAAADAPGLAPRVVVEFTPDVAGWMRLADFFIGKPGPGSISEAVQMGLPVIVTRNAWTMPQERWNTAWVREQGVGVVGRSFAGVRQAVEQIIGDLPRWQARVRAVRNDAVFEVPRVLAGLLPAAASGAWADQCAGGVSSCSGGGAAGMR